MSIRDAIISTSVIFAVDDFDDFNDLDFGGGAVDFFEDFGGGAVDSFEDFVDDGSPDFFFDSGAVLRCLFVGGVTNDEGNSCVA